MPLVGQSVPMATHGAEPSAAPNMEQRTGLAAGHEGSGTQGAFLATQPRSRQNFWSEASQNFCCFSISVMKLGTFPVAKQSAGDKTHVFATAALKICAGAGGKEASVTALISA
jgi:hypothetical protein